MRKSDNKAILLNMIWSCTAVIINYLINFLITPYVTNNIGVEAYGFVALANTFTTYIDIISVGLNAFASRFISIAYHKNDIKKANDYYSSTIVADIVLAIVVLVPCCFIVYNLNLFLNIPEELTSDVKILFLTIIIKYLLTVLRTAFSVATFIKNRLDISEKQNCLGYIIQGAILLFLCTVFFPHVWYVGLSALIAAGYLLARYVMLSKKLVPELQFDRRRASINAVLEMVKSGIWNSINNLGNILNSGLDLLITNLLLSATIMGQISIAKNLATICYTLVQKISSSFRPKQLRLYAQNDIEKLVAALKSTMQFTGLICNLIIAVFAACGYPFLKLWVPTQNIDYIFIISMIVLFSDIVIGVVNPLYYVFTLTKRLMIPCCITIAMGIANVVSMYFLIKFTPLGGYAVVLTTLVLNCVHFVDTPLYSSYCLKVKWTTFYPVIIRHIIACFITLSVVRVIASKIIQPETWTALVIYGAFYTAISLVILGLIIYGPVKIKKMLSDRFRL